MAFSSIPALISEIETPQGDCLILYNVSPQSFMQIKNACAQRFSVHVTYLYNAETGVLFITKPTELHQLLHFRLYYAMYNELMNMGLERSWQTFTCPSYQVGGSFGQPDSSGGPIPQRTPQETCWPTLVVHSGDMLTLLGMQSAMRWWFHASEGSVKLVLLIRFDRQNDELLVQKWKMATPQSTTRPMATSPTPPEAPQLDQEIKISLQRGADHREGASYRIQGCPLRLEFRLLFLREPNGHERDLLVGHGDFLALAMDAWRRFNSRYVVTVLTHLRSVAPPGMDGQQIRAADFCRYTQSRDMMTMARLGSGPPPPVAMTNGINGSLP